jgi:hypothetical protein
LQFSLVWEDAVQFSNERLTTLPGSHPGSLRVGRESMGWKGFSLWPSFETPAFGGPSG